MCKYCDIVVWYCYYCDLRKNLIDDVIFVPKKHVTLHLGNVICSPGCLYSNTTLCKSQQCVTNNCSSSNLDSALSRIVILITLWLIVLSLCSGSEHNTCACGRFCWWTVMLTTTNSRAMTMYWHSSTAVYSTGTGTNTVTESEARTCAAFSND